LQHYRLFLHQIGDGILLVLSCDQMPNAHAFFLQELQMAGINFKAFDLGGHEIARRVWKDYYAKVNPLP